MVVTRLWLENSKSRVSSRRSHGRHIVEKKVANDKKKTHLSDAAPTIGSAAIFVSVPTIIASTSTSALLFLLSVSSSSSCEAEEEEGYRALSNNIV